MSDFSSYDKFKKEAEDGGYYINDDTEFVQSLLDSINVNIDRYGYASCPCRLASGEREKDLDIICPCDYRDPDLVDKGACFCALYVTEDVLKGKQQLTSIPDRRVREKAKKDAENESSSENKSSTEILGKLKVPIWRCKVCGYLCGREKPPLNCPICKASQDRFEQIL
ncbi:ferredoxin thioredoxin reductase catalytic beta chain [Methanobrevibacter cuticularis]|uniref:ferredoxin:thioredoxin reductase n=1 Tax=Methanobrevibacter cuticularis TaxID=47311 RepID=A0A166DN03_9EURY|nr:ferredoxin-thioredoxin reductase catalytic domain-containing protein [Methanobrevibacter cuticularis]KZX15774.1 ferredoxin thioredoxin reductase catalytic beta chain [Methanobrevibacter cuticularis]